MPSKTESPSPKGTPPKDRAAGGKAEPTLDDRKAAILNAVVSEYVDTAQPVGSAHVTGTPGVEVSSATVRSEMAALESEGYLVQPHTSAGRIPTDKGYRFFVDHLARPGVLDSARRQEVRRFFAHVHGEVEDLLGRTSGLLAHLTDYAAVVVGPDHSVATVRAVQMVPLTAGVVLLMAVLSDGAVEKITLELPADTSETAITDAASHLTAHVRGSTLGHIRTVPPTGDLSLDLVVELAEEGLSRLSASSDNEHVFVGGSSSMASAFDAVETVRSVLSILEQQLVVVELVEDILDRGLSVAIGTEHGFEPLAACALVVAPVFVEGENAGTVGVLGPTRMHYPRALAAVQIVGEQLGEQLSGEAKAGRRRTSSSARRGSKDGGSGGN
ncbi:MAG TPA: heat-inducible transcriptional repressor HrcA [Acidimicrobiales bacterium]|nr:heat-inducible transcriptional repressor HrcA [Acidimicrobiales bacterium]